MISIIAAIGKNKELGIDNKLLWSIPADMKYFREKTAGRPVIMGRLTYESIFDHLGKPLPNRTSIVVTRQHDYATPPEVVVSDNMETAISNARTMPGADEVFIIGGAQIYAEALAHIDRLYLTHVHASYPQADRFFPEYEDLFQKTSQESHEGDPSFTFAVYERKNNS